MVAGELEVTRRSVTQRSRDGPDDPETVQPKFRGSVTTLCSFSVVGPGPPLWNLIPPGSQVDYQMNGLTRGTERELPSRSHKGVLIGG